jgi:DUF971 family protein
MAGLNKNSPTPTAVTVHGQSRELEVAFNDGAVFRIPFELMRVFSPSAEVQGHSPDQAVLQTGKRAVDVLALEPVGLYAVQPTFSDGHDSGIFSWDYLYFWAPRPPNCGPITKPACVLLGVVAMTPCLCAPRALVPATDQKD